MSSSDCWRGFWVTFWIPFAMSHSRRISGRVTRNCLSTPVGLIWTTSNHGCTRNNYPSILWRARAPEVCSSHHSLTNLLRVGSQIPVLFSRIPPTTIFPLIPFGQDLLHHHQAKVTPDLRICTHPNFHSRFQVLRARNSTGLPTATLLTPHFIICDIGGDDISGSLPFPTRRLGSKSYVSAVSL
ncbi:hypothetical protein K438DRAFT_1192515 [Mycena galopus ATCC 62051]|nr:hypothetical protein K438DRAFT_1192515 [Mycena galopus ATCC 62051]